MPFVGTGNDIRDVEASSASGVQRSHALLQIAAQGAKLGNVCQQFLPNLFLCRLGQPGDLC